MSFPTQPKRERADHRTRQTALKHESFAWAATLYPDDPEKVMELAGYKPSLAGHKKVLESPHVKKRMQDLKERVLCDGWRQAAEIVVEEPTKEAVITKLWEFATAPNPPAASQVTALNALAKHDGISVGVEEGGAAPPTTRTALHRFTSALTPADSWWRARTRSPSIPPMTNLLRVRLRKPAPPGRHRLPTFPPMIPALPRRLRPKCHSVPAPRIRPSPKQGLTIAGPAITAATATLPSSRTASPSASLRRPCARPTDRARVRSRPTSASPLPPRPRPPPHLHRQRR